jgi:hypothetical protein
MLTGKYRRIYYYHLKKSGGSTLNQWLDTLTFDERTNDPNWIGSWLFGLRNEQATAAQSLRDAARAKAVFHWSDVVHSHASLLPYVPPGTFSFTMLRDPVERLVSQVHDWRRLQPSDTEKERPHIRQCVADSQSLPLRDFLERHAYSDGQGFLNNYMTRALAGGRLGRIVLDVTDAERLLDFAVRSMQEDYHFVGLTEAFDLSRNALCSLLGLPPARAIPKVNQSRPSSRPDAETRAAADILEDLTRTDQALYDKACEQFDRRFRPAADAYDSLAFESAHAGPLLGEVRGRLYGAHGTRYSVRDPILGSGFHGRDGAKSAACAVWTGPECRTTLYMPVPSGIPLCVLLWIRGYAVPRQREQLRVRIDGEPVRHRFEHASGAADLLVAETTAHRDFLRLDIEINETVESGTPGSELHDTRKRGIAFDGYGWRRTGKFSQPPAVPLSLAAE